LCWLDISVATNKRRCAVPHWISLSAGAPLEIGGGHPAPRAARGRATVQKFLFLDRIVPRSDGIVCLWALNGRCSH
jgi:hypothetical protein